MKIDYRPVRRLIETDEMPIGIISDYALQDQNVRKGHLHNMHVWWATRPLAACRASIMATLLPDPADKNCPDSFLKAAQDALKHFSGAGVDLSDHLKLRRALFDFIAHFSAWDNAHKDIFIKTARKLIKAAHPDGKPLVLDPFAGMGSIPFEALRIGADAFSGDLNPVAVLLNKIALEYLPRYGPRLAEAVKKWGEWIRFEAIKELRSYYPLEADGSEPLAYIWARTVRCEGPNCGAEVPMVGLLWLSKKKKNLVALKYNGVRRKNNGGNVSFEIFKPNSESDVQKPIVRRFAVDCPVCGHTTPYSRVREQIRAKRGGTRDARMIAVISLKHDGSRGFRLATQKDLNNVTRAAERLKEEKDRFKGPFSMIPDEPFPGWYSGVFNPGLWNIKTWGDLFTARQSLALSALVRLVRESYKKMRDEGIDYSFASAVTTCLALAVSNMSHYNASLSYNHPFYGMRSSFGGNGMPMKADFAEANPLIPKLVGGFAYSLEQVSQFLEKEGGLGFSPGTVRQGSATRIPLPEASVEYVVTDPPYYAAVPYSDLSDFCYVWLKRMLYDLHPDLCGFVLTPKDEEAIAYYVQPPDRQPKDNAFFEKMMESALKECRRVLRPDSVAVVLFAHKGTAGWEAMLKALIKSGWMVTASWPIATERGARLRAKNSAVLASSVFLVCRPRPEDSGVGDWRNVLREMNERVSRWLPRMEREGIHGADAIFSCIGPALEVYSRFEKVETAGGEEIPLESGNGKRGYLSYVWEAVAREALRMIFPEADPQGFEEDSRVTALWLWTIMGKINGQAENEEAQKDQEDDETDNKKKVSGWALPYDDARLIFQALGADEAVLKRPGGIIEIKADKARLLPVLERRRYLLGNKEESVKPGRRKKAQPVLFTEFETIPEESMTVEPGRSLLDRVHQAMLLFGDARAETLRRFLVDEGYGKEPQFWRLAEALSRLYPVTSKEKRLIDGIIARRKNWGI